MANLFTALLRRGTGRRKVYADLLQLDDHLLRDIGLTRADVHSMLSGSTRSRTVRWHE